MKQLIKAQANYKPVYCYECRSRDTFERYSEKDIKTESGQAFMIAWHCSICGHTSLTSNREFVPKGEG